MTNTPDKKTRVSFSQFSTFLKCPKKWYYDYPMNLRKFDGNISTAFGTAIHESLQKYLEILYTDSVKAANEFKCLDFFKVVYDKEVETLKKEGKEIDDDTYHEFYYNGDDIITTFLKPFNRLKHFPSTYELVGIELPLEVDIKNNVQFVGFIDIVLKEKDKDRYKIIDFKTSYSGWNKYMKEDETKFSQLLLYKSVYSKKFKVPLSAIDVEFFIVKRNLYENVSFPQSRIQTFVPPNGPAAIKESIYSFIEFLDHGFNEDGTYNLKNEYPKYPGKNKKNCKYCMHLKTRCDGKETK